MRALSFRSLRRLLVDTLSMHYSIGKRRHFCSSFLLLQAIAGGVSHYLLTYIGETIVADLRGKLWDKVLRLPVSYYDANETGETMSRITQDTTTLKGLVTNHFVTFVSGIISIVGSIIILFFLSLENDIIHAY